MKIILKQASGAFYSKSSRWNEPILRSASGNERLISCSSGVGTYVGFGFFSASWDGTVLSRFGRRNI